MSFWKHPKNPPSETTSHTKSWPDWPARSKVRAILLFSKNFLPGITVLRVLLDYGTEKKWKTRSVVVVILNIPPKPPLWGDFAHQVKPQIGRLDQKLQPFYCYPNFLFLKSLFSNSCVLLGDCEFENPLSEWKPCRERAYQARESASKRCVSFLNEGCLGERTKVPIETARAATHCLWAHNPKAYTCEGVESKNEKWWKMKREKKK